MSKAFHKVGDSRLRARVTRLGAAAAALVLLLAVAGTLLADYQQEAKLLADDGAADDYFGSSVAVDGDTIVVGAPCDDDNGPYSGSAYVFVRSGTTWTQQAKLLADDGTVEDAFGSSVAIEGDTVVVGADGDDENGPYSGSAYIFVRGGTAWTQQAKLLAGDGASSDWFGRSVAIDRDTVVVGADGDDDNGDDSGSAYLFVRQGTAWTQQAKLLADDGAEYDYFGRFVAVDGNTVVVGAHGDDDSSGSAYIFVRSGTAWMQQAKLVADDGEAWEWFGHSVAIDRDTVVVGAYNDNNDNGYDAGSAYVFLREGTAWTQQAKLLAGDGASSDWFGRSVAVRGDTVVVGAYGDDDNGDVSGSAYVFVRSGTTWTQDAKLLADDGAGGDVFGESVAVDGDTVVVGADGDDDNGSASGSAYVYRAVEPQTWFEEDDPAVIYTGLWRTRPCPACSGGALALSRQRRAQADFAFEGSGLRWYARRGPRDGIARIYVDGIYRGPVDLYAPTPVVGVVWEKLNLPPGPHTFTIEVSARKNPASSDYFVNLDAFEIVP